MLWLDFNQYKYIVNSCNLICFQFIKHSTQSNITIYVNSLYQFQSIQQCLEISCLSLALQDSLDPGSSRISWIKVTLLSEQSVLKTRGKFLLKLINLSSSPSYTIFRFPMFMIMFLKTIQILLMLFIPHLQFWLLPQTSRRR